MKRFPRPRCGAHAHATTLVLLLILMSLLGCQSELNPNAAGVSGTVTTPEGPLSGATISFRPDAGTPGPKVATAVFDGEYTIQPERGLQPGQYVVEIVMAPELRGILPPEELAKLPPKGTNIDSRYHSPSQLRCQLVAGANNSCDFEVEFGR